MTAATTQSKPKVIATAANLIDLLSNVKGAKFVTITTKTEPALVAGNPFKGDIFKVSRVNGVVNWNYASSVNRQRDREGLAGDFKAEPRKWGTRLPGLPFVTHVKKGETALRVYLEMKVERSLDHWYENAAGERIANDDVSPWLRPASKSRQGVDREIILRDYSLDNILAIAHEGTVYVIEDNLRLVQDIAAVRS